MASEKYLLISIIELNISTISGISTILTLSSLQFVLFLRYAVNSIYFLHLTPNIVTEYILERFQTFTQFNASLQTHFHTSAASVKQRYHLYHRHECDAAYDGT